MIGFDDRLPSGPDGVGVRVAFGYLLHGAGADAHRRWRGVGQQQRRLNAARSVARRVGNNESGRTTARRFEGRGCRIGRYRRCIPTEIYAARFPFASTFDRPLGDPLQNRLQKACASCIVAFRVRLRAGDGGMSIQGCTRKNRRDWKQLLCVSITPPPPPPPPPPPRLVPSTGRASLRTPV